MTPQCSVGELRVGVVGGGWIAQSIVPAVIETGASVVGLVEPDESRRARWQDRVPTFVGLDELLAAQVDIVAVLTPTATHADIVCSVLEAGCDVLVEKPLTFETADADRIVHAAAAAHRRVLVDESYVWMPSHLAAGEALRAGRIGDVRAIVHSFFGWQPLPHRAAAVAMANTTGWRIDGGFAWMRDHLVHFFALSKRLTGATTVRAVRALGGPTEEELRGATWRCGTTEVAWIRATNGVEGVIGRATGLHTRIVGTTGWMDVLGEGGAWGDGGPPDPIRFSDGSSHAVPTEPDLLWEADTNYYPAAHRLSVAAALAHFVQGGGEPYDATDAADDVRAVDALIADAGQMS